MVLRRLVLAALLALPVFAAAGSAAAVQGSAAGTAQAIGVRVVVPGGKGETAAAVSAPPPGSTSSGGYSSTGVSTGALATSARASGGRRAASDASATVQGVSLFGGEITVASVNARASASASAAGATGSLASSGLAGVTILGEAVAPAPNARVPLGDWGYAVLLEQAVVREETRAFGYRGFVTGLHVHLTAEHGGLPAGTEIMIGYAEAAARAPKTTPKPAPPPPAPPPPPRASPPPPPPPPAKAEVSRREKPKATKPRTGDPRPKRPGASGRPKRTAPPSPSGSGRPKREALPSPEPVPVAPGAPRKPPAAVKNPPPSVRPALTAGGYVFPVYGPASFGDDFGAPRALTAWHHGNDIFASLGAPVLAVTDGTLFLVGWNEIGGNRLWLRDASGNEFYYAHLSAFSPLAFEGARVRAGDVIGFVGDTGDAAGTPPHLHFEIHPAPLLGLGYDGVVNPFEYLAAWRRLDDLAFDADSRAPGKAAPAAAVLLEAVDISTARSLEPAAVAEILAMPALFGEALPVATPRPPPPNVLYAPAGFPSGR